MRLRTYLFSALLGPASLVPAQEFGLTHQMVPASGDLSRDVALGDLDGDGDLDAFLGNEGQDRVYRNDGTGVFTVAPPTSLPTLVDATRAVVLGDVDGDGDLDAFVGAESWLNRMYLNDGTGTFTDVTPTNVPAAGTNGWAAAFGDVDADGDLDLCVGASCPFPGTGGIRLFLNGGAGVFTNATATNLPVLPCITQAVATGDLDGDGDLDLFLGTSGAERLLRNNGAGVFADDTAGNLPAFLDLTEAVALGDVDADGDLDALVGNGGPSPQANRLYQNNGAATFSDVSLTSLPLLVAATFDVALADADGDGDLDAFLGNGGSGLFSTVEPDRLYLNGGAGGFTDATANALPGVLDATEAVEMGDVDGDGDLDAFVANFGQQSRLYLNDSAGVFGDVTGLDLPGESGTVAAALGDVDGDGDLDAFLGAAYPGNRLYRNDGRGAFADVTQTSLLPMLTDPVTAVGLGDLDGDGDLDAVQTSGWNLGFGGAPSRRYVNNGGGVFTLASFPAQIEDTQAVALGDVDGDGDLDVYLGNSGGPYGGGQDRVFRNLGAGLFGDVTGISLPALADLTRAVALGDVDGDGDLDAYVGNGGHPALQSPAQDRLLLNSGTGVFADVTATNLPAILDQTMAVALGDVDGDGDLDAFVGNTNGSGQDRLLLNGGVGAFVDATATNLPALLEATRSVALGDMDEDGDLDALVGNLTSTFLNPQSMNRLLQNGGTGVFTDVTAGGLPIHIAPTYAVAMGDVDGDADLDAFVGASGVDRIYTNPTRQVSWRGIPRAGKPLTIDVRGPANGTWLLAASAGSASIPLPPFGTLRLFPPTLFIVAGGTLDPQGRASLTFPVPANPTLVGLSLYWQAVVGPPLRFTNLEVTTVTNL